MTVKCMISYYAVTNDLTFIFQKTLRPEIRNLGYKFFFGADRKLSLSLSLSSFPVFLRAFSQDILI